MGLFEPPVRTFNEYVSPTSYALYSSFVFFSVESFERDNDLADYNLSELGYREIFLTPLMRSLFRGKHREMSIFLWVYEQHDPIFDQFYTIFFNEL